MDISLISLISLLSVCSAALLIKKRLNNKTNEASSLLVPLRRSIFYAGASLAGLIAFAGSTFAQSHQGGEANLTLPDLSRVTFFGGVDGHTLLLTGLVVCVLGLGSPN